MLPICRRPGLPHPTRLRPHQPDHSSPGKTALQAGHRHAYLANVSSDTQLLDSGAAPTGFTNDAPFKKKGRKKDPAGSALLAIGILGCLLCLGAAALAFASL
ncbi:MAG: hypothetical protein RLZZ179_842 [Verrucomicrobiota bacterium]|jgi:hypothetical protein